MPSVHLESDDGLSIHLADVDGPIDEINALISGLANEGPTITATPCGAQYGIGASVRARTDFNSEEIAAVHEVVTFALDHAGYTIDNHCLYQSAADAFVLDAVEFTRLTVTSPDAVEAFALQPADPNLLRYQPDELGGFAKGGHQGVIVAAIPEGDGQAVYGEGDTAPLHQTLIYVGKIDDLADGEADALLAAGERLAAEFAPFTARVSGKGVLGPDAVDVVITESSSLQAMHDRLLEDETIGAMYATRNEHPTWVSHVTGITADIGDEIPFHSVAVWIGDEQRVEYPLTGTAETFHLAGTQYDHDQSTHAKGRVGRFLDKMFPGESSPPPPKSNPELTPRDIRITQHRERQHAATIILPSREDRNTKAARYFGKANEGIEAGLDAMFPNDALKTTVPFRSASRRKRDALYDKQLVAETLSAERALQPVDPRVLHATQQNITREGVRYYLGDTYRNTGLTYADQTARGNVNPVVYKNSSGEYMLLSGHHRAAAALLQGRTLDAVVIDPEIGPPPRRIRRFAVALPTTLDDEMYYDVTPMLAIDDEFADALAPDDAADMIRRGLGTVVASPDAAVETLRLLGATATHARWLVKETGPDDITPVDFGIRQTRQFHLAGTQYDHDQSTHAGGRGGKGGTKKAKVDVVEGDIPKLPEDKLAIANQLGASVPLPTIEELSKYDPVPETEHNENMLLRHLDEAGLLTPERRAIHDTLVYETLTKDGDLYPSKPEGERLAVMLGGGAAAGKSTALKMGYVEGVGEDGPTINPDHFKIELPEARGPSKKGKQGNGLADEYEKEWASIMHDESSYLGKRAIDGAITTGMDMVIDKTQSSGKKAVAQIRQLQENGYEVQAAFVTTDIDRAVAEAQRRGKDQGRYVGEEITYDGHVGSNRSYLDVITQTDVQAKLLTTYPKNPDGSYEKPVLTATATGTGALRVHDRTAWDAYVDRLMATAEDGKEWDPSILDNIELIFD